MKPEAQRIAIAKVCGWSEFEWAVLLFGTYTKGDKYWEGKEVPDYLNDLNAMHIAEKTLQAEQFLTYLDMLDVACGGELELSSMVDGADFGFGLVHATAAQRAEAFLKTLKLWKYDT